MRLEDVPSIQAKSKREIKIKIEKREWTRALANETELQTLTLYSLFTSKCKIICTKINCSAYISSWIGAADSTWTLEYCRNKFSFRQILVEFEFIELNWIFWCPNFDITNFDVNWMLCFAINIYKFNNHKAFTIRFIHIKYATTISHEFNSIQLFNYSCYCCNCNLIFTKFYWN